MVFEEFLIFLGYVFILGVVVFFDDELIENFCVIEVMYIIFNL